MGPVKSGWSIISGEPQTPVSQQGVKQKVYLLIQLAQCSGQQLHAASLSRGWQCYSTQGCSVAGSLLVRTAALGLWSHGSLANCGYPQVPQCQETGLGHLSSKGFLQRGEIVVFVVCFSYLGRKCMLLCHIGWILLFVHLKKSSSKF